MCFVINDVVYVPRDFTDIADVAQRLDVAEKFVSEAQSLIVAGNNAGRVLRKLQAARNVLTGRVEDPPQAAPEIAQAPVSADVMP